MSRLLQLKNDSGNKEQSTKTIKKDFVIAGSDIASLVLFDKLSSEFEEDKILVINDRETSPQEILHTWQTSALLGRGESFATLVSEEIAENFLEEPYFYKDQTLKPFSGRARPHKLLPYESFFIEKPYEVDFKNFFNDFEAVCAEYKNCSYSPQISSVDYDDQLWKIYCSDGSLVITPNLYWTSTREEFYKKSKEKLKERFTENEKNFLLEKWNFSLLNVYFELSNTINENSQTVFIPQSFTYDHGHFIVDFSKPTESGSQVVRAYALIYDHGLSEEEVGRKIRHLKKSLEKVYPDFFINNPREEVRFLDEFLSSDREEEGEIDSSELPHLPSFVGAQAPYSFQDTKLEIPNLASMLKSFSDFKIESSALES